MAADPSDLPWKRLDERMRVRPMGLVFGAWRSVTAKEAVDQLQ
jgi:hypothetical protein